MSSYLEHGCPDKRNGRQTLNHNEQNVPAYINYMDYRVTTWQW